MEEKFSESKLELINIQPDNKTHIKIKDQDICKNSCEDKACTYFCPTEVYTWDEEEKKIKVNYSRCIECLACPYGCPYDNIIWDYPTGGSGVDYTESNQL